MKITLLGTGDATGTPVIGCDCPTCKDALNGGKSKRYRFSILVESYEGAIFIDTGPDLKWQMIENNISHVNGVIWTHGHYDHYAGFGEFYRIQNNVDVYGLKSTIDYILDYLYFLKPIRHDILIYEQFEVIGLTFILFKVNHPPLKESIGVMILEGDKKVVITGDSCAEFPDKTLELIQKPDLLIADGIVPHPMKVRKHMNSKDAIDLGLKIGAKKTILTHLSHYFKPHDQASKSLPLGYDGMVIKI
ncbi:MAG: MBL fold metallo-hydrolase [Methanosarcinaceae archaeon]|jgi:phosphoribosyl 1,2-cyclic phosphate phosphodiesterase|nr:MBL fold metallo-hydrolase [Methanosarcinaceae archaeon]NKQ38453.1 MBL fold metallo-hydrolase [Methanosarcinales archaeon]